MQPSHEPPPGSARSRASVVAALRLERAATRGARDRSSSSSTPRAGASELRVTRDIRNPPDQGTAMIEEVALLSALDDRLVERLQRGVIRIVRVAWLLTLPPGFRILRQQELVDLTLRASADGVAASSSLSPLLSPDEAVALVRRGGRCIAVLSHGWLSAGNCDPNGMRIAVVQRALREYAHLQGLFWDQASLAQPPRSMDEDVAFRSALDVMGDLCTPRCTEALAPCASHPTAKHAPSPLPKYFILP